MNRGMMIQCHGCGFTRAIDLNGSDKSIEAELNRVIAEEGWRYVKSWNELICKKCRSGGLDPLYEAYAGKVGQCGKRASYMVLLCRAARQLQAFEELEEL